MEKKKRQLRLETPQIGKSEIKIGLPLKNILINNDLLTVEFQGSNKEVYFYPSRNVDRIEDRYNITMPENLPLDSIVLSIKRVSFDEFYFETKDDNGFLLLFGEIPEEQMSKHFIYMVESGLAMPKENLERIFSLKPKKIKLKLNNNNDTICHV